MRKRLLAIIATAAMVVAMVPSMVFADETVANEADLREACQNSGTVTLNADFGLEKNVDILSGVEVVVDLNGHKLTGADDGSANWNAFNVKGGKLTLKDSSAEKTGQIWAKCYGVQVRDNGTFIMESGKIDATNNDTFGAALINYGGTIIINDGILIGNEWAIYAEAYWGDANVTINGGNLKGLSDTEGVVTLGGDYDIDGKETIVISGGTFEGPIPVLVSEKAPEESSLVISGGQFPVGADIDEYLASNVEVDANGKVVEKATAPTTPADKPESSPATGDNSMAPFAVAGLALAAMAAVVATRRRTN